MSDRLGIGSIVAAYLAAHPAEAARLAPLTDFLASASPADYASRGCVAGHATASAFVLSPDRTRLLVIFHLKLQRHLQPGGHIENDATLAASAAREVHEETGLARERLRLLSPEPIDIDPHRIPAHPGKGEPEHWHFDIRYLFVAADEAADEALRADESEVAGASWQPLDSPVVAGFLPPQVIERIRAAAIPVRTDCA